MKIIKLAVIACAIALTGCAASGPKFSVAEATQPTLKAEQGRVYFYRSASILGGGLQPAIRLDGATVGDSKRNSYFYVDIKPGSHVAETSTEVNNKLSFVLDAGEIKYVRTSVQMGVLVGRVVPELVGSDEARKELAELNYIGQSKAQ